MTSVQEMQWVLRAQCRDREALEALLRSVQPSLRRYVCAVAGTLDADDLQQEILMIVVRRIGSLQDPALFRPWLFRIASREAFRHVTKRRLWERRHDSQAELDAFTAPEPPPSDELLRQLLASEAVSPSSRAVLVLHFQEGLTLPEVAAVLEVPLGTAKSRLAYGLRAIRKQLHADGESHDRQQ
jgi:RNA polymerase sigma-70 factor, ECF subfamily